MAERGMRGHGPFGRTALLLALSLRLRLHVAPLAAAEAPGGGACVTGDEVARLRCQLDEATERLSLAVKAKDLAVEAKDAELVRKDALCELALEAKDAELGRKEALVRELSAQLAHTRATIEELRADPGQLEAKIVEAEREEAIAEEKNGELEQREDAELDRRDTSAQDADTPEVGRQQAQLLPEDPRRVTAQLPGERYAGADEHAHAGTPRLSGAGSDRPSPTEEEEARRSRQRRLPSEETATSTAQPSARDPVRAERRLRDPAVDDLRRRSRRGRRHLRHGAPETATSRPGDWRARAGDEDLRRNIHLLSRLAADEEEDYRGLGSAGQAQEHRYRAGPGRGDDRPHERFTKAARFGRLLAAADLSSIIAELPDNTTRVSLARMGLTGTLPEDLGRLADLEYLDVSGNRITGTLPAALFRLAKLQVLQVQYNGLTGLLPAQTCNMAAMLLLDLSGNELAGTLPNCLGSLSGLQTLGLGSNNFTGTVPEQFGNLTQLTRLDLSENKLSGTIPPDVGKLTQLRELNFYSNQLSGTIPPDVGKLTQLRELYFDSNQLSGTIPPDVGKLTRLRELYLDSNQLSGTIPRDVGKLTRLTWLHLGSNQLSGTIPPDVGKLTQLTWLMLSYNEFTGTVPRELGNLLNLTYLDLRANELSGTIPPELGKLAQLQKLFAPDNQLTGTVPKHLGNLASLTILWLSNNKLYGTLPRELGNMVSLTAFQVGKNQLSGTIPDEYFGNWTQLGIFAARGNQLSGTILGSVSRWTALSTLMVSENRFSGTLPPELGRLSQLARLDVGANLLTGTVPDELAGRFSQLNYIDLSGNDLSGTLPLWMGQLEALQAMYVQGNPRLTGTFPDTTSCTSLRQIMAQGCGFTSAGAVGGSVQILSFAKNAFSELPTAWVDLPQVRQLDISDNRISEWMPYGVLPYGTFIDGVWMCGAVPLQTRLRWPAVESVDLSGNPFGRATTARDFIWSLAYLPRLSELRAARCQLQGAVPYEGPFFSVDMESTDCSVTGVRPNGFPALFSLDLSQNNLSSIMSYPPTRLHTATLRSNALQGLSGKWYSISGTLEVWDNPLLTADVLPPSREGGCPTEGAPGLEADPFGWVTKPGDDFQCTGLCVGTDARYKHDSTINASSLCRCVRGRQGAAMDCTGCPADTYSQGEGAFEMVRACLPCPAGSSTDGIENATGIDVCKCPAGWYMKTPLAGRANETNGTDAPACTRCQQGVFMDTVPGATKEDECACSRAYEGLLAVLGVCGCADGLYMDHLARACRQCDAVAERCAWGSAVELSLWPPVVEASYWAAPAPEPGPDGASDFSQHDIWRCFSRNTCKGDSVCASGRSGTACSLCDAGMYGGPDGPCHPCPNSPEESRRALLYGLLIGPAATLAAHMALQSSADSRALVLAMANLRTSLKQSVKYLQMLGVLSAFHVNWPPLARQFLTDIPRITVALPQLAGVACLAGQQSASLEMGFRWLLPVAGLGSACLSALVLFPLRRCCGNRPWYRLVRMSHWDVLRVGLFGLTLFFSTLLQFGTQVLTCVPSPNRLSTVLTFPHLACGSTGEWARLAVISSAFLLVFVVAVYLGVYAAWRRTARALVDSAFKTRGWWGFLFDDYRSGCAHWVLLSMAKDTALVVIATAGASDGPSQLLATTAGAVLYAYAVLRDQPFRDSSNSLLEAWTAMSMAALSVFTASMGYAGSPNLADVADLYPGGVDSALYKRRERALLAAQWLTFAGPAGIMLCQLLGMSERAKWMVPSCLRPWSEKERAEWNEDFLRRLNLDSAPRDLRGVMERFDTVDSAKFRRLMSTSVATLGIIRSSAGGISGMVRRRFSDAAQSSQQFQEALRNSRGELPALQVDAEEEPVVEQVLVHTHADDGCGSPAEGERQGDDAAWAAKEEVGMAVPVCPEVCSENAVELPAVRDKIKVQL